MHTLASISSIRAMCGLDSQNNCVHGSDSPQSAQREISFFFEEKSAGSFTFNILITMKFNSGYELNAYMVAFSLVYISEMSFQ